MPGTAVKTHKPEPTTASPTRTAPQRRVGGTPVAQGRDSFATRQAQARQANSPAWQQAKATPASQPRQTNSLTKVGTLAAASARVGASAQPAPIKAAAAPSPAAAAVLSLLQELPKWVLRPVTEAAHEFTGYRLLTVLLGFDPLTGQPVRRTAQNLADGLLNLSDSGRELNRALVKSGVLTRAGNVIEAGAGRHQLNAARLDALLTQLGQRYQAHSWAAMYHNPDLLLHPLKALATDVWAFLKEVAPPLLDLLLEASGQRGKDVLALLRKGQATYAKIMADPVAFLHNLLDGVRLGFTQFKNRALEHLGVSFTGWLFGGLAGNIRLKLPVTGAGLFQLGLSILDLSYDKLRAKLVKRLGKRGEMVVGILEEAGKMVYKLVHEGPGAVGKDLLTMAQEKLTGFKDQVLASLRTWLMQSLVVKGIEKLAAYLTPATALLESLHQIYTSVVFFLERADKFTRLLSTIVDAFADIANRNLKPAADRVETTLAGLLSLALDWFMRLLGLGNMPAIVAEKVTMARQWVDELLDKYLDKFIEWGQKLWLKGKQTARNAVGAVKGWFEYRHPFKTVDGATHTLYFEETAGETRLIRASTPLEIVKYLDKLLKKLTAGSDMHEKAKEAKIEAQKIGLMTRTADAIGAAANTTTSSEGVGAKPARGNQKATAGDPGIVDAVLRLATLLHELVELSPSNERLASPPTKWLPDIPIRNHPLNGEHQYSQVEYLTPSTAVDGKGAGEHTNEMRYALYADPGNWVRMHLITATLGGKGHSGNWVPAPITINSSAPIQHSFEQATDRLVRTQKIANVPKVRDKPDDDQNPVKHTVLWVHVKVEAYHDRLEVEDPSAIPGLTDVVPGQPYYLYGFARLVRFRSGMYLPPMPSADIPKWKRVEEPLNHQLVEIPLPDKRVNLNNTNKSRLRDSGVPMLANIIPETNGKRHPDNKAARALRTAIVAEAKKGPYTSLDGTLGGSEDPQSLQVRLTARLKNSPSYGDDAGKQVKLLIDTLKSAPHDVNIILDNSPVAKRP